MALKNIAIKYRRVMILATHILLILSAYYLSFLLRFDFRLPGEYSRLALRTIPILFIVKMCAFYYYGLFSGLWRYASIDDLWRIIKANFFSSTAFVLGVIFIHNITGYPRSIFVLDFMICTMFIGGARFFSRLIRERIRFSFWAENRRKKVLIVGAGEAGVMILRESRNNPDMNLEVAGFIDDDPSKRNLRIQGVRILGTCGDIGEITRKYDIREIILAIPSAKGETIRSIISSCSLPQVQLKIVPGMQKILEGELEIKPREVRPEDLLGRETVKVDRDEIGDYLTGKTVMVTGAGGSIGSVLCRQIAYFSPAKLILLDHNENNVYFLGVELQNNFPGLCFHTLIGDIKDVGLLKKVFSSHRPEVIFHAAAHKHVPLMEENPVSAVKNNVLGTRNLIYASNHYGTERFVLISTDKAVNPTSIMGATKRIAEMLLQYKSRRSKTKFMAVRFGNVLGSDGSVVPLFKKQIDEGGPVMVTHPEARRYFMSIKEAAQLVLQAGAIGKGGEIFILDMGEQIKIIDLARNLIRLCGYTPDVDIPIKFIGLRPGEKLYEETLLDAEKDKATKCDKIFVAQPNDIDSDKLKKQIRDLINLALTMQDSRVVRKIKEIVPFFVQN